jgi:hypothetical protein
LLAKLNVKDDVNIDIVLESQGYGCLIGMLKMKFNINIVEIARLCWLIGMLKMKFNINIVEIAMLCWLIGMLKMKLILILL